MRLDQLVYFRVGCIIVDLRRPKTNRSWPFLNYLAGIFGCYIFILYDHFSTKLFVIYLKLVSHVSATDRIQSVPVQRMFGIQNTQYIDSYTRYSYTGSPYTGQNPVHRISVYRTKCLVYEDFASYTGHYVWYTGIQWSALYTGQSFVRYTGIDAYRTSGVLGPIVFIRNFIYRSDSNLSDKLLF
jgi:hypothetical protein